MSFVRYSSRTDGPESFGDNGFKAKPSVHKKRDGYALYRGGFVRFLTFWEGMQYRFGFRAADEFCGCYNCQRRGVGLPVGDGHENV